MVERLSLVRHPISQNIAFHFYLRSILNADLGESLVRGMPGVGFFVRNLSECPDGISTFERFSSLIHCMNIIILVYYDG